jgi:hypothetical protein
LVNADTWPPAKTTTDTYQRVYDSDAGEWVRARAVRLWGERVLINAAGDAYCDGADCQRFVPLADLAAAGNTHRIGLPPVRGALLPWDGEETRRPWRGF